MTDAPETPEFSPDFLAQYRAQKDKEKRAQLCNEEMTALLEKYRCRVTAQVIMSEAGVQFIPTILALD